MTASPRQPSWGEVLDTVIGARLRGVHTAMVGEIQAYSESSQTATVTLAVQLEAGGGEFETVAPLEGVPVIWPGAWAAGDTCLLIFCEESFAKFWESGSVEQPEVLRRHGLHAVCIPIVARAADAVQFVALANLVDAKLAAIQLAFDCHTHATAGTGAPSPPMLFPAIPPVVPPPTFPIGSLASVAASKVKAR